MDGALELVLIVVGILANGFFAASEFGIVSARASRLAELRAQSARGAAAALRLKETPEVALATIQIAITTVGVLASAVGGATAVRAITPLLVDAGLDPRWAQPLALGLVIVAVTYVSLVLGELAPKALALRNPERVACLVSPLIASLSRLSALPVTVLTVSTNAVLGLFGLRPGAEPQFVTEEEVRYLIREGAAKGVFEKVEEELVHNVFEFADTTVREVMVPRVQIRALDVATPPERVLAEAAAIGHSRLPVYRGSIEQPLGVVIMKDLLRAAAEGRTPALPALLRPALFVPETARVSALLKEFQRTHQNLALVVDEYGGVVGLVTVEDVIEEIVGDIREEHEAVPPPPLTRLDDGSYLVDGSAPVTEVRDQLGAPADDGDYNTLAGYVITSLDAIPRVGDSFTGGGYRWTVVAMDGPRVSKVRAEPERVAPPAPLDTSPDGS